jgi:hypothetical protein
MDSPLLPFPYHFDAGAGVSDRGSFRFHDFVFQCHVISGMGNPTVL